MSAIDLHIHSCHSDDCELDVAAILDRCHSQGIELAAITDHNSVQGVSRALELAGPTRVLAGVELDCIYKDVYFHLLGYGFDHTRPVFGEIEADILRQEQLAGEERIIRFRHATGIPVSTVEVLSAARGGVVTGELIAQVLLDSPDAQSIPLLQPYLPGGARSDMPHVRFYWDFFAPGKPAFVPVRFIGLEEGAALLHEAGGVAVLAHPGQNLGEDYSLLPGLLQVVDGLEAFSSYHTPAQARDFCRMAVEQGKLVTAGSDFHGKHKPQIALGGHGAAWDDGRLLAQPCFAAILGERE